MTTISSGIGTSLKVTGKAPGPMEVLKNRTAALEELARKVDEATTERISTIIGPSSATRGEPDAPKDDSLLSQMLNHMDYISECLEHIRSNIERL